MTLPAPLYILSAEQISPQRPLCQDWTCCPRYPGGTYCRSDDPDFRRLLRPAEARRMGRLLKRAAAVSDRALAAAGADCPDAIVTGTGWGCVESTEQFLQDLCTRGEHLLSPTHFMQSTHNTVSALLAIRTHCHGYNATFTHGAVSFDCALHDAALLLREGSAGLALVGGHDEVTPDYRVLLRRMGYAGLAGQCPCCETSVALTLSATPRRAPLCRLDDLCLRHRPAPEEWADAVGRMLGRCGKEPADVDLLICGHNGLPDNDRPYDGLARRLFPHTPQLRYKRLFGENFIVSAASVYAAAHLLRRATLPPVLGGGAPQGTPLRTVLVVNHSGGADFSAILLERP